MPRIEIELTSARPDGTWTWRAAGARQPKGALDGSLLHAGAKVGEVVRADVDVDVDGMTVTAVLPAKTKRAEVGRLEVLGPPARERQDVTVERAGPQGREASRGPGGGPPRPDRRPDRDRDRERAPRRPDRDGERPTGRDRDRDREAERGDRERDRDRAGGRPPRGRERPGPGRPPGAAGRPGGERPERTGPPRERAARPSAAPPPPRPRPKRLHAGRAHRDAVLASLPPEEQAIAEQVLRGGVPAVRQALEEQNAAARAAGQPEVRADALVALAERLAPRLRAAEWRDRAEAAVGDVDEIALRDLRALVAGSDAAMRDEASRELAERLRRALEARSAKERDAWLAEITEALDAGRVVRALRSSCRPPEPGARFPADLAERLGEAAGEAMAPDVPPDRWAAVLEAVIASPVRRVVKPRGLPPDAPQDLLKAARQAAERVPALGPLVGAPAPPPIGTRRPAPPPPPPRRPPAPPAPEPAAAAAPSTSADVGHGDTGPETGQAAAATDTASTDTAATDTAAPGPGEAAEATPDEGARADGGADAAAPEGAERVGPSGDDGDDAVLVEELG